ncbi:MAG: gamma-glutamyltransferase [Cyanobacteria bacterium J06554_11]
MADAVPPRSETADYTGAERQGVVAAGHEQTAAAGRDILQAGGNAFDAAIAAALASCVVEPTLASLGGGGFLLAHTTSGQNKLFDFFTQTPARRPSHIKPDFFPIEADFGDSVQEFHIGLASMAVPGMLAGMVAVHRSLGQLPFSVVAEPAIAYASKGVTVSPFQGYCYQLLEPILLNSPASRQIYAPHGQLLQSGDTIRTPDFANTLEYLTQGTSTADYSKTIDTFYAGEIASSIVRDCQEKGGYLSMADFQNYRVIERDPLSVSYRGTQLLTNPPPSAGGALIAFCLELLNRFDLGKMTFGSKAHLTLLSQAMRWTNVARRSHLDDALSAGMLSNTDIAREFIATGLTDKYARPLQEIVNQGTNRWGSTTHISVIDGSGNAASITTSNGEGASYVIPGTQIMMNNMLGEEDLNPHGFHQWPLGQRMSSMMAPTIVLQAGKPQLVLGSGGSNRIRTAILQVISNVLDFEMPLSEAVEAARLHWENGVLHLEPGLAEAPIASERLGTHQVVQWQQPNMFFGGVHAVGLGDRISSSNQMAGQAAEQTVKQTAAAGRQSRPIEGKGDPRRSGAVAKS